MAGYFAHEITAVPTSMFKDPVNLRKTVKSQLTKELLDTVDWTVSHTAVTHKVIDGGWLLHKVKWQSGGVYQDILGQYGRYILLHFGSNATIVYDGYESGPSTKDYEHMQRSAKCAPHIVFDIDTPAYSSQSAFLGNQENKKAFVSLRMRHFESIGLSVTQAEGDADTLIVRNAVNCAASGVPVTVVANDTDVLITLLYHSQDSMEDITIHIETTKQTPVRRVDIRKLASSLSQQVTQQLPVIHAISGCDTTSSLYGHGKAAVYRTVVNNKHAARLTAVLGCSGANAKDVDAGLQLLVLIYGSKHGDSLNRMRYSTYMDIISRSTLPLRPERLPPTEGSATQHVLCTHLQAI